MRNPTYMSAVHTRARTMYLPALGSTLAMMTGRALSGPVISIMASCTQTQTRGQRWEQGRKEGRWKVSK